MLPCGVLAVRGVPVPRMRVAGVARVANVCVVAGVACVPNVDIMSTVAVPRMAAV